MRVPDGVESVKLHECVFRKLHTQSEHSTQEVRCAKLKLIYITVLEYREENVVVVVLCEGTHLRQERLDGLRMFLLSEDGAMHCDRCQ